MMKLCDRCPVGGCCLDYLGSACQDIRAHGCPDIQPNRAELISNMTISQMASQLIPAILYDLCEDGVPSKEMIERWLKSEPEHGEYI